VVHDFAPLGGGLPPAITLYIQSQQNAADDHRAEPQLYPLPHAVTHPGGAHCRHRREQAQERTTSRAQQADLLKIHCIFTFHVNYSLCATGGQVVHHETGQTPSYSSSSQWMIHIHTTTPRGRVWSPYSLALADILSVPSEGWQGVCHPDYFKLPRGAIMQSVLLMWQHGDLPHYCTALLQACEKGLSWKQGSWLSYMGIHLKCSLGRTEKQLPHRDFSLHVFK
jgi:hypothetical protein